MYAFPPVACRPFREVQVRREVWAGTRSIMKKRFRSTCHPVAPGAAAAGSFRNGRSRRFPSPEAGIRSSVPNRPSAESPARRRRRRKPFCYPPSQVSSRRSTFRMRAGTEDRERTARRSGRLRPSARRAETPP